MLMPKSERSRLWELFAGAKIYDLSYALEQRMPFSPNHPGFRMALLRRHGDRVRADGGSAANELMVMGGHSGTHMDALCHVSQHGLLYGGANAEDAQKGGQFNALGAETIPPILCRGLMLDIPAALGLEALEPGAAITIDHIKSAISRQSIEIRPGDAVLIRSGWPKFWSEPEKFVGVRDGAPGLDEKAAVWLAGHGICMTGAETIAYECIPPGQGHSLLPVHRVFLVDHGIYLVEVLNLTELARDHISEFLFILTPIKVVGATGVPVRPLAVIAP
jgi:kynurenine formamidase